MTEQDRPTVPPGPVAPRGTRRAVLAAVAACLVVGAASFAVGRSTAPEAGATGAGPAPVKSAAPCRGGTYTWFGVHEEPLLTGVSRASSRKGETPPLVAVARPKRAVHAPRGAGVDPRETLYSLALHIGEAGPDDADDGKNSLAFADPADAYELDGGGIEFDDDDGTGTVEWAQVASVRAQFRLECGDGRDVYGRAESWTVDGAGVLACQEPLTDGASATAREAALLSCAGDDPANTGRKPKPEAGGPEGS
ncbi:hypothetical protein [Streptomyces sp. BBFR102]|uniref:hypothetical protein n=1 Tax=Streptomyces sp. BBFR102 TaxID=3448171 RepID=UPI003F53DFDC